MTPQIIYLLLTLAEMLMAAHQHGKPKEGKNNFWISLLAWLIIASCLYYGGFFDIILNHF